MPLGVYLSVPFCRTKCSFCNFASDVFSRERFDAYVARVTADIAQAPAVGSTGLDRAADSIYLGGGTPSVLAPDQLQRLFDAVRRRFDVSPGAEITVECAPGTVDDALIATLRACGVNRVSLGVQSFVDEESRAVGRLHTRAIALADIARLRDAGIAELNLDLIAGLPHQTLDSWRRSLDDVIATGAPHVSVYMLEVDEDSRLGRELMAGGTRYHAHFVPDEAAMTDFYEHARAALHAAGIAPYEISNFARAGHESRHNLKYWTRRPYLGFGVDAHSMLPAAPGAVRFATPDNLDDYMRGVAPSVTPVTRAQQVEEAFFLGLRLEQGIDLAALRAEFGEAALAPFLDVADELVRDAMLARDGMRLRLTDRGRLISNEVFERFLGLSAVPAEARQRRAIV